jgi:hypothetical protein
MPKFEAPFRIASVITEQQTFDRLNFRREMRVFQPIPDGPVGDTNTVR